MTARICRAGWRLALLIAAIVWCTGCIRPASLRAPIPPAFETAQELTGKSLQVLVPRDLRPDAERRGAGADLAYLVPAILINVSATRGSDVSGKQHFTPHPIEQLRASVASYIGSTAMFSRVGPQPGDYALEVDVLHLVAHQYSMSHAVTSLGGFFSSQRRFMPSATVTLRLRLRTRSGRVIGTRVVSGSYLGGPHYGWTTLGFVARRALVNALFKARRLVASWALADRYRSTPLSKMRARYEAKQRFTFLVHRVADGRTGAELYELEYPSGRVLRVRRLHEVPVVGEPGQWLVSPFNIDGVFYPAVVYAALTAKLARRFVLRRFEQLDVYRYLGPRAGAPPASAPASAPSAVPPADQPAPPPEG